jgi:hypothetical protein
MYTDASCVVEPPKVIPTVRLCYLLFCGQNARGGIATLSEAFIHSMKEKRTYIAHGEAMAVLLALYHEKEWLLGSSVVWFIDNLGVLSCLCKGSSTVADISCIVHAILLSAASLKTTIWWEHVDSAANGSDGGTRQSSVVSDIFGIALTEKSTPPWPTNTLEADASVWLRWLKNN